MWSTLPVRQKNKWSPSSVICIAEISWGRSCIWDLLHSLMVIQRSVNYILVATAVLWGFCQRKSSFILHWDENARDVLISKWGEHCPVQLIQWSLYIISCKYALIKSKTHSPAERSSEISICPSWWKVAYLYLVFVLNSQPRYRKSQTNSAEISQDLQRGVRDWGAQAASLQGLFFISCLIWRQA